MRAAMTTADLTTVEPNRAEVLPPPPEMLNPSDLEALRLAVVALERSTLAGRLSSLAGRPLELLGNALPAAAREIVSGAVERALKTALRVAITTLPKEAAGAGRKRGEGRYHTALAAASGAFGGALGLVTLPLELPVSTTIVLRAIADIARREGEDLSDPEVALACLQVFALGSHAEGDDLATSGYFAVRGALAKTMSEIGRRAATTGFADGGAPALVRLVAQIAARFGVVVSQKAAAGAVPIVGALGGAAVNAAFIEHFRTVARAHFTIRRLERSYGIEAVRAAYERLKAGLG